MHIFNVFPTIIYACLLAALVKSEEKAPKLGLQKEKV